MELFSCYIYDAISPVTESKQLGGKPIGFLQNVVELTLTGPRSPRTKSIEWFHYEYN